MILISGSGFISKGVRKPRCIRTNLSVLFLAMSMSKLRPDSSSSSEEEGDQCQWDWQKCTPADGTEKYVMSLQLLGVEMANAVPKKIRAEAITALDITPTSDIIIGRFDKTPTKERLLTPS